MAQVASPKKSPWGARSPPVAPVSIRDIQSEQLARQLRQDEDDDNMPPEEAAALAAALAESAALAAASAATTTDSSLDADMQLARLLQAQLDYEEMEMTLQAQRRAAQFSTSKISFALPVPRFTPFHVPVSVAMPGRRDADNDDGDGEAEEASVIASFDRLGRVARDAQGEIVTKHNATLGYAKTRAALQHLPLGFQSGDVHRDTSVRLSNRVYNSLKRHADRSERARPRDQVDDDRKTTEMSLDKKTRLVLLSMANSQVVDKVHGAISTGKEAVLFHAERRPDPDDPSCPAQSCAIKVFKTMLTEFKERQQFMQGDRRREAAAGRQSTLKLVKVWAEREADHLTRINAAGLPAPAVIARKNHVLVMTFIGADGRPAPKLKDVVFEDAASLADAWAQCRAIMIALYQTVRLVHADLSPYNLLYHAHTVHVIDVGQAVDPSHPLAKELLYRDCACMVKFFERAGAVVPSPAALLADITGVALTPDQEAEVVGRLQSIRGTPKTGLVLDRFDPVWFQHSLADEKHDDDDDDDDDEDDDEDDEGDEDDGSFAEIDKQTGEGQS